MNKNGKTKDGNHEGHEGARRKAWKNHVHGRLQLADSVRKPMTVLQEKPDNLVFSATGVSFRSESGAKEAGGEGFNFFHDQV